MESNDPKSNYQGVELHPTKNVFYCLGQLQEQSDVRSPVNGTIDDVSREEKCIKRPCLTVLNVHRGVFTRLLFRVWHQWRYLEAQ